MIASVTITEAQHGALVAGLADARKRIEAAKGRIAELKRVNFELELKLVDAARRNPDPAKS